VHLSQGLKKKQLPLPGIHACLFLKLLYLFVTYFLFLDVGNVEMQNMVFKKQNKRDFDDWWFC